MFFLTENILYQMVYVLYFPRKLIGGITFGASLIVFLSIVCRSNESRTTVINPIKLHLLSLTWTDKQWNRGIDVIC